LNERADQVMEVDQSESRTPLTKSVGLESSLPLGDTNCDGKKIPLQLPASKCERPESSASPRDDMMSVKDSHN
jgi:hypothetical protein